MLVIFSLLEPDPDPLTWLNPEPKHGFKVKVRSQGKRIWTGGHAHCTVHIFLYGCATRAEEETVRAAFQPAAPVDFDSLRSLADEGIDMSFMDSLQKQYNASRLQVQS